MMFRFPLQRLLELRAKREQELARQLAVANRDAADAAATHEALRDLQETSAARLAERAQDDPSVGELMALGYTVSQIAEQADVAQGQAEAAAEQAERQSALLTDAIRDRQVLDRLRERRHEEFRAEEALQERASMDAIALGRFVARTPTQSTPTQETP